MTRREILLTLSLGAGVRTVKAAGLRRSSAPSLTPTGRGAPSARLRKVKDLVIYRDDRKYCGPGPGVAVLGDGRVMIAFRRVNRLPSGLAAHQDPRTEVCTIVSADGVNWNNAPRRAYGGDYQTVALTRTSKGTLLMAHHAITLVPERTFEEARTRLRGQEGFRKGLPPGLFRTQGWPMIEAGANVFRSTDDGQSWDGPHYVRIPEYPPVLGGTGSSLNTRNPVVELSDGTLVFAVYNVETATSALLVESTDEGLNWRRRGMIARGRPDGLGYNETMIHECPSGDLVAFMRGQRRGSPMEEQTLYTARSGDEGRTWSTPRRPRGFLGHPFGTARMPSGNVLLVYGYRLQPFGIRARLLDPECTDIMGRKEFVLRDDGGGTDLGYPLAATLPNGQAIVVYYMNDLGDRPEPPYGAGGTGTRYVAATIVEERV